MRQIPTSPFPSQGRNPWLRPSPPTTAASSSSTRTTTPSCSSSSAPTASSIPITPSTRRASFPWPSPPAKSNLFVVDTYQPLPLAPTPSPAPAPSASSRSRAATRATPVAIGSPAVNPAVNGQYWPLTLSGANASDVDRADRGDVLASGAYVYVTAYDSSVTPNVGYVFGFSVGSGGALTPLSGSPFPAGSSLRPSPAILQQPMFYVTDFSKRQCARLLGRAQRQL